MSHFPIPSTVRSVLALSLTILAALLAAVALPPAAQAGGGITATGKSSGGATSGGKEAKYTRIWKGKIRKKEKRWAHRTAICESGKDPNATALGGKYRGAFMFLRSSWKNSPKSPGGDPIDYTYRTQAVVAVLLKRQMGSSPWPVCG